MFKRLTFSKYYLLSIMEMIGIVDVLYLCGVKFFLQSSEIIFGKFSCIFSCKCFFYWMLESLWIFFINGLSSGFSETLTEKIFWGNLWDVTCISWDVLSFNILGGSSNPVFSFHWIISILQLIVLFVFLWWINMIIILLILWFTNSNINIVGAWFLTSLINQFIDITSCASENLILFGNVACITW